MAILRKSKKTTSEEVQMSLLEEHHVQPSQSQDLGKEFPQKEETSHLSLYGWLKGLIPDGLFGKMSPVSCHRTTEEILLPSSQGWQNAGMGSPTGFLTLSLSEHNDFQEHSHKDEGVSSLSDVLETGEIQQRYYLTEKQCQAILRRAEKNQKKLPESLEKTVKAVLKNFQEQQ